MTLADSSPRPLKSNIMGGSQKFSLSPNDVRRIGKGFLLSAAGFVAAYITTTIIPALSGDANDLTRMVLVAAFSVAANALRLFASDTRPQESQP